MTPEQLAARITANLGRLHDRLDDLQEAATAALYRHERRVVHVRTGRLRNSLTPYGPYRAGPRRISGIVPVGVPYADIEHRRGDDHAYGARTVAETRPAQEAWRRGSEAALVQAVEG